ncbi:MAG: hypothetical protein ABIS50_08385 [Luteolibacter sp.]|uniref:hypothetical protein n=1 Tax=Luteolibacter sp. TaxID=1962973 RepID=UPI00326665F0
MKTNLVLIGMVALALGACDKKEEVSETGTLPKKKAFGSEVRPTSFKPLASKPGPVAEAGIAQIPATGPGTASEPSPATAVAPAKVLSATEIATEQLRQERLARMAKAREERIVQATAQLTTRFKEQDVNGDGFLAKDEVDGRMQRRFADADKNSDGFLDATEQETMIQAASQRMGEGGGQRRGGQGGGLAGQGRGNRNP